MTKKSPTAAANTAAATNTTTMILEQQGHRPRSRHNISSSLQEPLKNHEPPPFPTTLLGTNLYGRRDLTQNNTQDDSVNMIFDYDDDDDVSEAGSEFTADYSRHRLNHHESSDDNDLKACSPLEDGDDESSLSSQASFGVGEEDEDDEDDWSCESSSASSAVDSRALAAPRRRLSLDNQYLLQQQEQDLTEFSVEEDPLFNADGIVNAFAMPLSSPRKAQPKTVPEDGQELWSDDDSDENSNGEYRKESEPLDSSSFAPQKIWKETEHGSWVVQSLPVDTTDTTDTSTSSPPPHPASSAGSSLVLRPPRPAAPMRRDSSLSVESTDSSVESFATEDKPYDPIKSPSATIIPPNATVATRKTKDPMIPLRPDPNLRVDDSSEDEGLADDLQRQQRALSTMLEEVFVFSDDEEEQDENPSTAKLRQRPRKPAANLKPSPRDNKKERRSTASNMAALINKYSVEIGDAAGDKDPAFPRQQRSKSHPNPIVPTPLSPTPTTRKPSSSRTSILIQSSPRGHMENESPILANVEDPLQYSMNFTQTLRISPNEHRAPLKDHSKRPRKKRKSPKGEKKSSNKKSSSKLNIKATEIVPGENQAATEQLSTSPKVDGIDYFDDDCSVASDDSNDSLDAAVCKQSSKKDSKKKKKKDKDRTRKRGRKSDWWGADDDDDADNNNDEYGVDDASHKVYAVADRVEAIFANKQVIFDTTIHDDPQTSLNPSKQGSGLSKPEAIVRGRNKPVGEEQQKQSTRKSTTKEMESEARTMCAEETQQPQTIRVKSKAAEEETQESRFRREESKSQSKSKSRGRSVSKERSSKTSSRSRSKSKDVSSGAAIESRSRSKSVTKEKFRSRSESGDKPKMIDRTKSDCALRRRAKKDSPCKTSLEENDSISVQVSDLKDTKSSPSKRKLSKTKSLPKKESLPSSPAGESNAVTIQDLMDDNTSDDEASSLDYTDQKDMENQAIEGSSIEVTRIKIQRLEKKFAELQKTTEAEIEALKNEFVAKKTTLREKIVKEKERLHDPAEAILCLHKMIVNDYHANAHTLKKAIKSFERGMTSEIVRSVALTTESQEWNSRTAAVVWKIQRMELDKGMHIRAFNEYQMEHRQLLSRSRNEFSLESSVLIGDVDDYGLPTLIPLFQRWEIPSELRREVSLDHLNKSYYKLPKSSIFYNIFHDNDYKLTFTK